MLFERAGLTDRLVVVGVLAKQALADALHAMDVFAFASKSETQGMVLTEAMAAGLPVIALDASGVREVIHDRRNGLLLHEETPAAFDAALRWAMELPSEHFHALKRGALATADAFSLARSADTALACYDSLVRRKPGSAPPDETRWRNTMVAIRIEWELLKNVAIASDAALGTHLLSDREP
jgi:glycosyltransferase involved in cell wall biosynthesis